MDYLNRFKIVQFCNCLVSELSLSCFINATYINYLAESQLRNKPLQYVKNLITAEHILKIIVI